MDQYVIRLLLDITVTSATTTTPSPQTTTTGGRVGSGSAFEASLAHRSNIMQTSNPSFVLRAWIAQEVIAAAERGDYSKVRPPRTHIHMHTD